MNGRWKVADDTFQGKAGNVKEGGDFRSGMRSPMPGFPSVLQKKYKRRHVRHTTETASRSWLKETPLILLYTYLRRPNRAIRS